MTDKTEVTGCTVTELGSVEDRAKALGLIPPSGICILPRFFFGENDRSKLVYEATTQDLKVLFRQQGIALDKIEPDAVTIPYQAEHDAKWIGPIIFIGVASWVQNPHIITVALGMISNYVTDFFKGKIGQQSVDFSIAVEQTEKKKVVNVHYSGSPEGIKEMEKVLKSAMK